MPADVKAKLLTGAAILDTDDLPLKALPVREWNTKVYIRSLPGSELEKWVRENAGKDGIPVMASLAAFTLCDKDGKRLFSDGDAERLQGKNARALKTIFDAACIHNGLDEDAQERAEGNSETAPTFGSSSS